MWKVFVCKGGLWLMGDDWSDTNHWTETGRGFISKRRSGTADLCNDPWHLLHGDVNHDNAAHMHRRKTEMGRS